MKDLLFKTLELIETPLLIYNQRSFEILYYNSKADQFIEELKKRNIFSNLNQYDEKEIIITIEEPLVRVYLGKIKKLDEENYLIYFDEIKKDKPFSGFLFDVFENLPVLVFLIKDGNIFYTNRTVEQVLGYKREEIINKNLIRDLIWDLDKPKAEIYCKRIARQGKEEGKIFALEDKFGRIKNFFWNCFLTKDWNGEPVLVSIASDISEYLELSQKIEKLHKTQTFVEFLRGLVHDFNNLLQTILDYLNKLKVAPLTKMEDLLYCIEKNIYSWIDINRILLDYTKEVKELRYKKIDLIEFLKENLEVFQFILGDKIKIYLDLGYFKNLFTYGDSAFWRYIFLNFLTNAKDAIDNEGEIYISINKTEDSTNQRSYIKLTIRDTGSGIPEEIIPRIFDPFFTTKKKGSGLGLFLVNHHIKGLDGFIEVESKVGVGTTFHLYVPIDLERPINLIQKEVSLKGKKIIIVEDEEEIRDTLKEALQERGALVYTFAEGEELLKNLDKLKRPDLMLIDLNLPDIYGKDLIIKVKDKIPTVKILYLTGDIFILSEIPESEVLLKPFKIEELFQKIIYLLQNEEN